MSIMALYGPHDSLVSFEWGTAFQGIGTDPWKVTFKFRGSIGNHTLWSPCPSTRLSMKDEDGRLNFSSLWINSGIDLYVLPDIVNTITIERTVTNLIVTLNGDSVDLGAVSCDMSDLITEISVYGSGYTPICADVYNVEPPYGFRCRFQPVLVSDFEFYKGASLLIQIPFSSDYADHSGNAVPTVLQGTIEYVEETNVVTSINSTTYSNLYYSVSLEVWKDQAEKTEDGEASYIGRFYDINGGGNAVLKTISIPANKQVSKATFRCVQYYNSVTPTDFSMRIAFLYDNAPVAFSSTRVFESNVDYENIRGSIVGGTFGDNLITSQVLETPYPLDGGGTYETSDLSTLVNQVGKLGPITSLLFFIDDHQQETNPETEYRLFWGSGGDECLILVLEDRTPATSCEITYFGLGADGSVPVDPSSPYTPDSVATVLSAGTLTKSGYAFNGWNTKWDGSGTNYNEGDPITVDYEKRLYAQWLLLNPILADYMVVMETGGDWSELPHSTADVVAAGDGTIAGLTKLGCGMRFNFDTPIPRYATVTSAYLEIIAATTGLPPGGVGAKSRIFASLIYNSPAFIKGEFATQYQPVCGTIVGGADDTLRTPAEYDVTWDDQAMTVGVPVNSPDISNIIQQVVNAGELSSLVLFWVDHDGRSDANKLYMGTPVVTLYITTESTHTVTYDANGGTGTTPVDPSSPYDSGSTVTVLDNTDLTKVGYNFVGWNTSSDGTGTDYAEGSTFTISINIILYAKWLRLCHVGNITTNNNGTFYCIQEHDGTPDTEPGVGANWRSYWVGYPALHSDLTDLQGGDDSTSIEYYHLTEQQHTNIGSGEHNGIAGLQGGQEEYIGVLPNIINDDCTSLDGWTNEEGEWQVTGGGFHWRGSENGNLIPNPAVTWSGLTGTTEVRTQFITLDDHDNSTDFRLYWAINSSYLLDIFWCQDGVWTFDIALEMNVKICDIDYTDTTWRIEFDSINGSCSFYKNGTLISTFNTPANAFVIPFFQFVGCEGTEGYILPNIKVGDGLGEFQNNPDEYYHLTDAEHTVVQNTSGVNTGDQISSDFYHNDLSGLQGGDTTANEFYHLTADEHDRINPATDTTLGVVKVGDGLTITPEGVLTVDEPQTDHNYLNDLQGGDSTSLEFYHLTSTEHDFLITIPEPTASSDFLVGESVTGYASEIGFNGEVGANITDTNGQIVTKVVSGSNTIDVDGAGNAVITLVTDTPGLTQCYTSEPVISDTDLLAKDFTITISDYKISTADSPLHYFFLLGDIPTLNLYYLIYSSNEIRIELMTGGVATSCKHFDWDEDRTVNHTFVLSRASGIFSLSVDGTPVSGSDDGIDGTTLPSYAGTGYLYLGQAIDMGVSFVLNIGNFSMEVAGSGSVTTSWTKKTKSETEQILDHNNLDNLQGGDSTSSEYYHLTAEEHTNATSIATEATLGLSMIGTGLTITEEGLLSARLGFGLGLGDVNEIEVELGDGLEFDGLNQVALKVATDEILGGVIVGNGLSITSEGVLSAEEPVLDHNLLENLQGGDSTSSEYYHLTSEEYIIVQNTTGVNTGDQTASDFNHNDLSNLNEGDYQHLTSSLYGDLTDAQAQIANLQTDKTPTFAGVTLGDAGKVTWDVVPASDQTVTGNIASLQAGEGLAFADSCYLKSDGKWYKTDANASTTMPCMAIVADAAGITGDSFGNFLINWSVIRYDDWNWTIGGLIYVSESAGGLTQTAPVTDASIVQVVGFGLTAKTMAVFMSPITIEVGVDGVDLGTATPTTITFAELSSTPKTWYLDHSSDQTVTFAAPASGDKFKRFTIMKTGTGAGAVIIDCPASVYIYAEGQATTSGGTLSLAASKRGCVTLIVTSTTSLQVVSADGDLTFA